MYGFLAGADLASAAPASASAQPKHSKPTQLRRLEERIERQMVDRKRCVYEKGRSPLFLFFFKPFFRWGGGLCTARARAHPPPPPRLGRAPGSTAPGGPRRRKQGRGPHRSRRQPTPLPGLRCGTRLARRASPPRRPTPVVRSAGGVGAHPTKHDLQFCRPFLDRIPKLFELLPLCNVNRERRLIHFTPFGLTCMGCSPRCSASRDNLASFRWRHRRDDAGHYSLIHPIYGRRSPSGKEAVVHYCARLL
jgi:hypothetical protein